MDGSYVYVADTGNCLVRQISLSGLNPTSLVAGKPPVGTTYYCLNVDGTGNAAQFNNPMAVAVKGTDLYVADASGIRRIDLSVSPAVVSTWTTKITTARGLSVSGNFLYVAGGSANKIWKVWIP
jgi:hypothetical protein